MIINVKLHAGLKTFMPDATYREGKDIEIEDGAIVKDMVSLLKIPPEEAHLVVINKKRVHPDHIMKDGDELIIFPPIGGG